MPTIASSNFPTPKSWDEFEDICLSVAKLKFKNTNFNRYGRTGQKQHGVDITGKDSLGSSIGVQCKNTLNFLTEKIIEEEVAKAESFTPCLSILYIATSSPPDAPIQSFIQKISNQRVATGSFAVGVLFWTDIEQELSKDVNELKRFYPQFSFTTSTSISSYPSKKDKDISVLNQLFSCINIDAIPYYLRDAPQRIHISFLDHVKNIEIAINNPLFQLYDKNIEEKILHWIQKWFDTYSLVSKDWYSFYISIPNTNEVSFVKADNLNSNSEENKLYASIQQNVNEFLELHYELCQVVHINYPEIDLNITSSSASQFYI
ncbi:MULTISPECIES: hypothetical protein [Psychrobacter]|uniref:hypothetical protein n=1 Tax=Psychrobacter TaxID=497 RepID=UPI0015E15ABC|nr:MULTISPECIES: hypothetical protein [Psychrobacter]